MTDTFIYIQTDLTSSPMVAACDHSEVLPTIAKMVRLEDSFGSDGNPRPEGEIGVLEMCVANGDCNEEDAPLYYLGLVDHREELKSYDGQSVLSPASGSEVYMTIRPMVQKGEAVQL